MSTRYGRLMAAFLLLMVGAVMAAPVSLGSLHDAAKAGDADQVVLLLRSGADVDEVLADSGATALMLAAQAGHIDIVRVLLGAGADISLQNGQGRQAEEMARENGHSGVASLLGVAAREDAKRMPRVRMVTSMGDIVIELNGVKAPISTANFLAYADEGFYDGTIFHRVIGNFMIQGGGFTPDMQQKRSKLPIDNEWSNGLKNDRGTIAMARLGGEADSATSQFFINVVDNAGLDQPRDGAGYAVFGKVVEGMDVVDRIKAVPTGSRDRFQDVPVEPVTIESVKRVTEPADN